ncbi:ribonuclease H [Martelella limonii]|uniref:ribonuclease H n=1 Tax=Martelella limonii TaxID=1647649 RepID=UPI00158089D5|nr:ribonuclease H [Martelella limonii]
MTYLYLDIETIPTQDDEVKRDIAANIRPPASMKKEETIAKWEAEQKPDAIKEAIDKTSFDGAYGSVSCIGFAVDDSPVTSMSFPLNASGERLLLGGFYDTVSDALNMSFPVIVGHYITGFDLRFLWQRSMVLGIRVPAWLPRDPKPWDAMVFDTMTAWAGARDTIGLDRLCKAFGVGGKDGVDGSMVAGMFERGEHEAIAEYCRDDVERVRSIHRKMMKALGEAA